MEAQSGENIDGYSLENLELEYETIRSKDLAVDITKRFMVGRSLSFGHVTLLEPVEWNKDSKIMNETINIPRKSMRGILMLFQEKDETESEKFIDPKITEVKITIEGVPNMVHSKGLPKKCIFEEAQRLFENDMDDPQMKITDFYDNKYSLWIDLHTTYDKNSTAQSGVLFEINKAATTKDIKCYIS